jgi:hypothetical protein
VPWFVIGTGKNCITRIIVRHFERICTEWV